MRDEIDREAMARLSLGHLAVDFTSGAVPALLPFFAAKFDLTESESLLIGTDFGIATDIQTGPNGNLYVVSLSNGAIYEIFRLPRP